MARQFRSPDLIRTALAAEMSAAAALSEAAGWRHLERAHILSQPWSFDHVRVHVAMARRGWHEHDRTEVRGQIIRMLVAGPGSLIGRYPVGNTGRARISATRAMPITDDDLTALLHAAGMTHQDTTGAVGGASLRRMGNR